MVALAAALSLAMAAPSEADPCIGSGDERAINAALSGPGARAILCPMAIFNIHSPVILSAAGQELATEGNPAGASQALIRIADSNLATAIFSRASRISVHHLGVDGGRPRLGALAKGEALIELGGAVEGVAVDHVRAFDPRGWSALHVFEGGGACTGARITNSQLGPAGSDDGAWADGLSFACRAGLIAGNTIIDATDGGIVLFGAPGTVARDNVIVARTRILLGGINLVDYAPFAGDYSGTVVRANRIEAPGGFIKVGIAIGPGAWGIGSGAVNRGVVVRDNTIVGDHVGYGVVVDGADGVTVVGNRVLGRLGGELGVRCDKGEASPGQAFVRDARTTRGHFQSDFRLGNVRYAICITPGRVQ